MKLSKDLVVLSCLLASCSGLDEMTEMASDGEIRNAVVRIAPYTFDDGVTRTDLIYKDNKITFNWDDDETIGVFPISPYQGSQAYKHLERSKDDGHVATFDGGGWKIRPDATYAAYYPYNGKLTSETTFDKIPVSLKRQVQGGYNNLDHIGKKYDYMCAAATAPSEGDIVFNFKHITSIVQLEVTLPEPGVITNVLIIDKQHEQVFVDSALMNVYTHKLTPVHKSAMVELGVEDGVETKANEKVLLYVAMMPRVSRPVDITIETQSGKCYETTYTPKDMKAGYAYRWSISPEYAGEHVGVDLGLSVKWATTNIGAKNPIEGGNHYAWGETLPHTNNIYNWSSYKWCNGTKTSLTKYCSESTNGIVDNRCILEVDDDAASVNWGSTWRMPTLTECRELINNCYWVWTNSYNGTGKSGCIVYKAKSTSDKGKLVPLGGTPSDGYSLSDAHIFFPVAGYRIDDSLNDSELRGQHWTSSCEGKNEYYAWDLSFYSNDCSADTFGGRCYGRSVRAVCE